MGTIRRIALRTLATAAVACTALAAGAALLLHHRLSSCLPITEGRIDLEGLSAAVRIDRDVRGVPTIRAANRLDAARALGWLHGQDRYFQMDLMRRRAAGELAELVGPKALPLDRSTRPFEFRRHARQAYRAFPPSERALIDAYVAGVNAGLHALKSPPWEYALLRENPKPWTAVDSLLSGYSMILVLEDSGRYEASLDRLREVRGAAVADFFAPELGPDDDAIDGSRAPLPPIPGPADIDLRREGSYSAAWSPAPSENPAQAPGSNAFALAGRFSAGGGALLANDMHLSLSVPCTWYRAVIDYQRRDGRPVELEGLTLPGSPALIAGSNGRVAWGMTNSFADTSDLVRVDFLPGSTTRYRTPAGPRNLVIHHDTIRVRGAHSVELDTPWTVWGPLHGRDARGRPYALAWTAEDPRVIDLGLADLANADTVAEALAIAQRSGVPSLNFIAADRSGSIGWTVAGPLPRRVGLDGRLPASWADGRRGWDGWLPPSEHPAIMNPPSGYLSSANERLFGGRTLALLGDGGYEPAYRAAQLRADVAALAARAGAKAGPADLLAIQLDDRALHLERWRALLIRTLSGPSRADSPERARLRQLVSHWEGRAVTASVAYTLVRDFKAAVLHRVLGPVFAPCMRGDTEFEWWKFHYEPAVWSLLEHRPGNLLAPEYHDWDELLLAAADDVIREDRPLGRATWGRRNRAHIVHPFAALLPGFAARWISMPEVPLDGDRDMPRVAAPDFGASERLAVEPGREAQGILQTPGGNSSNPLSPFFRAGFEAWATGKPTPLLPGRARYHLELAPARGLRQPPPN
ncbi:penicillin acylase 2 precursor [mine drainage metagenome]|uniref:Penicillin acylase 2 n=1 Tax=mine drainage metagenome TaxID=410659 RepID=A0A1J5SY30_9ZZZZ